MADVEWTSQSWGMLEEAHMGEGLSVQHLKINAGERLPLRTNGNFPEHWIVVKGTGRVHLDAQDFLVDTGGTVFIPPRTPFAIANVGDSSMRLVAVHSGAERKSKRDQMSDALKKLRKLVVAPAE